jgi:acid phosphatase type 7
MQDRRSLARNSGLVLIAFVATLILLAGLLLILGGRTPPTTADGSFGPSADPSESPAESFDSPGLPASASPEPATPSLASPSEDDPVLVGAGDIGDCKSDNDEATAALLDDIAGTVFTLGDNAYPDGTAAQFEDCYDPTWGRHKQRTRPIPGNHDYHTKGASAYLDYFGKAAVNADGDPWYSYDLGEWHIIALDSECEETNDCVRDSKQGRWLTADLAASDAMCTMAMWHVPRFSSGFHSNDNDLDEFWRILYDAGADVILNGHDHDYERFAPQDPDAVEDRVRGIRAFVAGTGGTTLRPFEELAANSELRAARIHGVLKFTLHPTTYEWEFIPTTGDFRDSGSARCH